MVIPRPPCRSTCEKFNQKCGYLLTQNGAPLQDCSSLPESFLTLDFGNHIGASVHCTETKKPIASTSLSRAQQTHKTLSTLSTHKAHTTIERRIDIPPSDVVMIR